MRSGRILGAVALAVLLVGTADAQDDSKKTAKTAKTAKKPWKGGRIPVKKDHGTSKELKGKVEALLLALKQRAEKTPAPTSKPVKPAKGDPGIAPPKPTSKPTAPVDKAEAALLKSLRAFAPTKAAIVDALTPEGVKTIGRALYKRSRKLFTGSADEIAKRLKLDPKLTQVQVFQVSTEDLIGMEIGTLAGKEFASALRRTARLLKGQYRWYCVLLKTPKAKADDKGLRLQLFVHFDKRYVFLGKVWRLDK